VDPAAPVPAWVGPAVPAWVDPAAPAWVDPAAPVPAGVDPAAEVDNESTLNRDAVTNSRNREDAAIA